MNGLVRYSIFRYCAFATFRQDKDVLTCSDVFIVRPPIFQSAKFCIDIIGLTELKCKHARNLHQTFMQIEHLIYVPAKLKVSSFLRLAKSLQKEPFLDWEKLLQCSRAGADVQRHVRLIWMCDRWYLQIITNHIHPLRFVPVPVDFHHRECSICSTWRKFRSRNAIKLNKLESTLTSRHCWPFNIFSQLDFSNQTQKHSFSYSLKIRKC